MDELGSNLDQYSERKADMRKALKALNEDCPKWLTILKALPGEPTFGRLRKEAIESGEDLASEAKPPPQRTDRLLPHPQRRKRPAAHRTKRVG